MYIKSLLIFSLLLLVFSCTNAEVLIKEYDIVIDNLDKEVSEFTYTLVISGNGIVNIPLPEGSSINAYYKDTFETIEYTIQNNSLSFAVNLQNTIRTIVIKNFVVNPVVSKNSEKIISFNHLIEEEVGKLDVILKLPINSIVSDAGDESLIFPEPTHMLSDGKRIISNLERENFKGEFELFVTYKVGSSLDYNYILYISIFFVLIIAGLIIFFVSKTKCRVEKVISVGLSKEEKEVYDFIKTKDQISQKEVLNSLKYSKPRLSKLIRKLEEKELINKKPQGRTNILSLKKI